MDKLFSWNDGRVEDVRFWCEPELTRAAIARIADMDFPAFDGFATFEARGFILAGIAGAQFGLPTVPIRKHKKFYDRMPHEKVELTNWKNEPETLTVLTNSLPQVRRVLIVDDILDTGRSLTAGCELLKALDIEVVGAFYLLNSATDEILSGFKFPIREVLKRRLFEG